MDNNTKLFRQINKDWIIDDFVSSQAFRPTQKDQGLLSVYDGDQITAENAYIHYTKTLGLSSCGVVCVTVGECQAIDLSVRNEPDKFKEHSVIDFTGKTKSRQKKLSGDLRDFAKARGWLFQPSIPFL